MDLDELMGQISDGGLTALVKAGRYELKKRHEGALLKALEEWSWSPSEGTVATVEFGTNDYDDGWQYDSAHAAVTFVSGTQVQVDMDRTLVHDALVELGDHGGPLAGASWLKVDMTMPQITSDRG